MQIAIHNLTKCFGSLRANDGLSLSFAGGQIHGVLGENGAGKSTMMKLISGYLRPDGGEIRLDDQVVHLRSPGDALRAGVGMVHQEPLDVPAFSVLENLLCAAPRQALPSRAAARTKLLDLARQLHFSLEPDAPVNQLTVGQRQQLELVRLLLCGARTLILDEPTTGITAAQARALFAALRQLANSGSTVLFVSHKLNEVAELCDTVSVLRSGQAVGRQLNMPQPQEQLLQLMFGAAWNAEVRPPQGREQANGHAVGTQPVPTWQLEAVRAREGNLTLANVNLELPAGRVIGLAGLDGSGQQILLRLLAGRMRPEAGRIRVHGQDLSGASASAYRQAGIEYLPADRMLDGVIGALSLTEHFALLQGKGQLVDWRAAEREAREAIAAYGIKATPVSRINSLSGGNQQRAMLALVPQACRGIACEQPTRGLDVASARAIWQRLLARRDAGCTIVFASPDLDELMNYSDQIMVFFAGACSPLMARNELSSTRLAELIGGVGFTPVMSDQ
ncbi:ABC transporter ATP-binding protein [Candidatus Viridilinea mediisalina]|uniref:ABC transporter n=1 Tax=Candidatus Viridilinea mediisalina TaxID=2024553 RepID=A0A2A6RHV0_9CHLR|nr:ATP-binding cassette domain-containing protein [Candidatus Viridilinea mediisalina]PDW02466.1 ABC transporter [Candidatus Viridilinea mediisalina]